MTESTIGYLAAGLPDPELRSDDLVPPEAWCEQNKLKDWKKYVKAYAGRHQLLYRIDVLNCSLQGVAAGSSEYEEILSWANVSELLEQIHEEFSRDYSRVGARRYGEVLWTFEPHEIHRIVIFLQHYVHYLLYDARDEAEKWEGLLDAIRLFSVCVDHATIDPAQYERLANAADIPSFLHVLQGLEDGAAGLRDRLVGMTANDHFSYLTFLLRLWSLIHRIEGISLRSVQERFPGRRLLDTLLAYAEAKPTLYYAALRRVASLGEVFRDSMLISCVVMARSGRDEYVRILEDLSTTGTIPNATFSGWEAAGYLAARILGWSDLEPMWLPEADRVVVGAYWSVWEGYEPGEAYESRLEILRDAPLDGEEIFASQHPTDLREPRWLLQGEPWCVKKIRAAADPQGVLADPDRNLKQRLFDIVSGVNCLLRQSIYPGPDDERVAGGGAPGTTRSDEEIVRGVFATVQDVLLEGYRRVDAPDEVGKLDWEEIARSWLKVEFEQFLIFLSHWASFEESQLDVLHEDLMKRKAEGGHVAPEIEDLLERYGSSLFLAVRTTNAYWTTYPLDPETVRVRLTGPEMVRAPLDATSAERTSGIVGPPGGLPPAGGPPLPVTMGGRIPPGLTPPPDARGVGVEGGLVEGGEADVLPVGIEVFNAAVVMERLSVFVHKVTRLLDVTAQTCVDRSPATWSDEDHRDYLLFLAFEIHQRFREYPLMWDFLSRELTEEDLDREVTDEIAEEPEEESEEEIPADWFDFDGGETIGAPTGVGLDPHQVVRKNFVLYALFRRSTCWEVLRSLAHRYEPFQKAVRALLIPVAYLAAKDDAGSFARMAGGGTIPGGRMEYDEALEVFGRYVMHCRYGSTCSIEWLREEGLPPETFDWTTIPLGMDGEPGAQAKAFISILNFFVPTLDDPPAAGSLYCQAKRDIEEIVERVATTGGKGLPCCDPSKQAFREELAEGEIGWAVLKGMGDMARGLDNAQGLYTEVILDDFEQYVAENNIGAAWLLTEVAQRANASQEILESMAEAVTDSEMVEAFKDPLLARIERARDSQSRHLAETDEGEEDLDEVDIDEFEAELEELIETWEAEDEARQEAEPASTAEILSKLFDAQYMENLRRTAQSSGLPDIQPGDLDDEMDEEDRDEYLAAHPWLLGDLNYAMFAAQEIFHEVEAEAGEIPGRPEDVVRALESARLRVAAWSPMEAKDVLRSVTARDASVERTQEVASFFASLKSSSYTGMEVAANRLAGEDRSEPALKPALPHELRAIAAAQSDKPGIALEEAQEAVRIAPEDHKAHAVLSVVHATRGEVREALAAADEAIGRNEASPFAHVARALALRKARRYDESGEDLDRAMELPRPGVE